MDLPLVETLIVGADALGAARARSAAGHRRSRLVGVVDASLDRARAVAELHGVHPLSSAAASRDAIRDLEPDLVVVTDRTGELGVEPEELVQAALEADAHVLVEPGISWDPDLVDRLARLAHERDLTLAAGLRLRHRIAIQRALDHVHDGDIGIPVAVRAHFVLAGEPPVDAGRGVSKTLGVQLVDLARAALGEVTSVSASLDRAVLDIQADDLAHLTLRHAGVAVPERPVLPPTSQIQVSFAGWRDRFSFFVQGTHGTVAVEGLGSGFGGLGTGYGTFGTETLVYMQRPRRRGRPERTVTPHEMPDGSIDMGFDGMVAAVLERRATSFGNAGDMRVLARIIAAAVASDEEDGRPVPVEPTLRFPLPVG